MNSRKELLKFWSSGTKTGVMRSSRGAIADSASTSSTVSSGSSCVSTTPPGIANCVTFGAGWLKQEAQVLKSLMPTTAELSVLTLTPEPSSPRLRSSSTS